MFDVCVVGHVTRDIVRIGTRQTEMPGGTACYSSIAMKSLGMDVAVVTKLNENDRRLLDSLYRNRVDVFLSESLQTTSFMNIYLEGTEQRRQKVTGIALPFTAEDVEGIQAKVFHLGPLTRDDIPLEVIVSLAKGSVVSLDAQGFLRENTAIDSDGGQVRLTDWPDKEEALRLVTILKTDEEEARVLSHEKNPRQMALRLSEFGPTEVIITRGNLGSLVYAGNRFYEIPAFPPRRLVDPTGCGDTYMAGYLFLRQTVSDPGRVGEFAARTATAKLENSGPLISGWS
jgi:sugar/nucleoside kinase (ribokinase family)